MEYHYRYAQKIVTRMARNFPVVVVIGARQVGKTTLLEHLVGDHASKFVFDPVDDLYGAQRDPDLFLREHKPPLILDEVQYVPNLLAALKRHVDRSPEAKGLYYLSGSQNLSVLQDVAESLAGRAGLIELPALSIGEWATPEANREPPNWLNRWMTQGFDAAPNSWKRAPDSLSLCERLWTGTMPGLLTVNEFESVTDFFRSYLLTYIERDVRRAGDVNELEVFRRFVGLMGAMTAREVNISHLGRELGIHRATAQKWLAVMQATYQWISLPPYHGNTLKRVYGHRKGYLHDTGLAVFLQRISTPKAILTSPSLGPLFETLAVTNILKLAATMPVSPTAYHWRLQSGAEVDMVLELDGQLWPFEFKASTRISRHDASGINAFRKTYPGITKTPAAILAPVEEPIPLTPDIWALPYNLL
jgi:hypothetical protein